MTVIRTRLLEKKDHKIILNYLKPLTSCLFFTASAAETPNSSVFGSLATCFNHERHCLGGFT